MTVSRHNSLQTPMPFPSRIAALMLMLIASHNTLRAQESVDSSESIEPSVQLEQRLQSLMEATDRLRRMRELEMSEAAETNRTQNSKLPPMGAITDQSVSDGESSNGLSEIRERIRVLQRLRRSAQYTEQASQPALTDQILPVPQIEPVNETKNVTPTTNPAIDESLSAAEQGEEAPTQSGEDQIDSTNVSAERLLPRPVNTLALGESLYRTGHYDAALRALLKVDPAGMSQSDRMWLDLLTALCQRKTKAFDSATGTLREIANESSTDYPVQAAKWYLKYAESNQKHFEKLEQLSGEIELIVKRVEANDGSE